MLRNCSTKKTKLWQQGCTEDKRKRFENVRSEANYTGLIVWSICTERNSKADHCVTVPRLKSWAGEVGWGGWGGVAGREPLIVSAVIRGSGGPRVTSALELLHLLLHPGTLAADAT